MCPKQLSQELSGCSLLLVVSNLMARKCQKPYLWCRSRKFCFGWFRVEVVHLQLLKHPSQSTGTQNWESRRSMPSFSWLPPTLGKSWGTHSWNTSVLSFPPLMLLHEHLHWLLASEDIYCQMWIHPLLCIPTVPHRVKLNPAHLPRLHPPLQTLPTSPDFCPVSSHLWTPLTHPSSQHSLHPYPNGKPMHMAQAPIHLSGNMNYFLGSFYLLWCMQEKYAFDLYIPSPPFAFGIPQIWGLGLIYLCAFSSSLWNICWAEQAMWLSRFVSVADSILETTTVLPCTLHLFWHDLTTPRESCDLLQSGQVYGKF